MEWTTVSFIKDGYCKLTSPYKSSFISNTKAITFKLTKSAHCV